MGEEGVEEMKKLKKEVKEERVLESEYESDEEREGGWCADAAGGTPSAGTGTLGGGKWPGGKSPRILQGVSRHWIPENLAKSQTLFKIRQLENNQVSSSCLLGWFSK